MSYREFFYGAGIDDSSLAPPYYTLKSGKLFVPNIYRPMVWVVSLKSGTPKSVRSFNEAWLVPSN